MNLERSCTDAVADRARPASERLHALLRAAWEWEMHEFPERATWTGFPGQNARWSDRSRGAIERRRRELGAPLAAAKSLPRDELAPADQLNLDLFVHDWERTVEEARWPFECLCATQMDGVHQDPPQLLAVMPAGTRREIEDVLARLEGLPALFAQTVELLREGLAKRVTPPRVCLRDMPQQVENLWRVPALESPLLQALAQPAASLDRAESDRLRTSAAEIVTRKIVPTLQAFHRFLVETYLPGARETIAWRDLPDGEAWYAFKVREQTTTKLSPREIHETGLSEVRRIRSALEATIRASGFTGDFAAFCEFLRTDPRFYFTSADALLKEYRDICKRVDPELVKLFRRLPRLPYGVIEIPAYAAESQTTAYYLAGSLEAARPGYFYANTSKLSSRPRWEMEALSLHEAVPGHHLQLALAQELELPDFRRHGGCNAYVEGWALYSEALGEQLGFYRDPYSKFGQLSYEMWRAIRLVVDTGLHALGWSREQAIEYFAANTGKPLHDITVEVDRYLVWPAQALSYKIGELEFWKLRREAEAKLGEGFDLRAFHDQVLGEGALPLGMLARRTRAWMEGAR